MLIVNVVNSFVSDSSSSSGLSYSPSTHLLHLYSRWFDDRPTKLSASRLRQLGSDVSRVYLTFKESLLTDEEFMFFSLTAFKCRKLLDLCSLHYYTCKFFLFYVIPRLCQHPKDTSRLNNWHIYACDTSQGLWRQEFIHKEKLIKKKKEMPLNLTLLRCYSYSQGRPHNYLWTYKTVLNLENKRFHTVN